GTLHRDRVLLGTGVAEYGLIWREILRYDGFDSDTRKWPDLTALITPDHTGQQPDFAIPRLIWAPMTPLFKFLRRSHRPPMPDRAAGPYTVDSTHPGIEASREAEIPQASTNPANVPQNTFLLRPTTDSLLEDSRFRVLVVGKVSHSGVGKSSLINAVFRANNLTKTSDDHAIKHNIDEEFTSHDNDRLILHDSQGFVGGDIGNLRTVQEFIKRRSAERELKDRLHAIWLCCEIPVSGGRVFELGDEILLKDNANNVGNAPFRIPQVPIIVVFTKYDQLVVQKKFILARSLANADKVEWVRQAEEAATEEVKVRCEKPLNAVAGSRHTWTEVSTRNEHKDTIRRLIDLTMNSILAATDPKPQTTVGQGTADSDQPNLEGLLFAVAQRGSLGTKISTSIRVGKHKYWGYMFSGTFNGIPLDECVGVIHDDIVNVWNFNDPNHQCLKSTEFRSLMTHLVKDLASERPNPPSLLDNVIRIMPPAVAVATSVPPAAPFVLPAAAA
ncbi:hypothetical protein BS47DRAFT_1354522, partial [Hydnum rufescens UP504]